MLVIYLHSLWNWWLGFEEDTPAETLFCVLAAFLSGLWTGRMLTCGVWKLTFWALARTGVCVSKWAVFDERLFFLWILEAMLLSADFGAGVVPGKPNYINIINIEIVTCMWLYKACNSLYCYRGSLRNSIISKAECAQRRYLCWGHSLLKILREASFSRM